MDKKFDVCLVMPPIANIRYSSLALSLLKSCLINEGISCTVDYASMRFANLFGLYNCSQFLGPRTLYFQYMPEIIFSEFAGIKPRKDINELIKVILEAPKTVPEHLKSREALKNFLDELRIAAKKTIDETTEKILSLDAKIVGLTSSFRQECASLAIMKKLKEINPSINTIIGGANCMGTAGIAVLKKFKFVDYVFLGEADDVFGDICRHILDGEKEFGLPYGLLRRGCEIPGKIPHRIIINMSKVPSPEADDVFEALKENFTDDEIKKISPVIMTEGSRGCWWGEKHSCTFCGLNGLVKTYRQKKPQKIADELNYITDRYGNYEIWFSDCILSRPAGKELPELLRGRKEKMRLFTEVKSNMNEDELKNLAEAGFVQLQPGIESLSDVVLKLMNKGNTAINHVALLKYAQKYSVGLTWNFMYGFPGEDFETYEELCEFIPLIHHLPAPTGGVPVAYHRNSVYCDNLEKYSLKLKPSPVYDYYLPDDEEFIKNYAYTFVDESEQSKIFTENLIYKKVNNLVQHWRNVYLGKNGEKSECLDMIVFEDMIKIFDTRRIRVKSRYELTDIAKEIYLLCNEPKSHKAILETLTKNYGEDEIEHCLDELTDWKLLLKIRDEFLSLAVERPQEFLFRLLLMNAG